MPKSAALDQSLLALIFNATPIANIADNASVAPYTIFYVALHTADPTTTGTQTTNEVSYSTYARIGILRSSSGWTVSGGVVTPNNNINFATANSISDNTTAAYFSIGTASSGAGSILYTGGLSPSITITNGTTPIILNSSSISES